MESPEELFFSFAFSDKNEHIYFHNVLIRIVSQ